MTAVINTQLHLRISDDVKVLLSEKPGRGSRNQRLDFNDGDALHLGIDRNRARSYSCTAANHENRTRMGWGQRREMSKHPLQAHVARHIRGLDFSSNMECTESIRKIFNRYR